jgi:hypothetical protein
MHRGAAHEVGMSPQITVVDNCPLYRPLIPAPPAAYAHVQWDIRTQEDIKSRQRALQAILMRT